MDYREILRLDSLKSSQRSIAAAVSSSRHTIRDVLAAAKEKNISWPIDSDITNLELEQILFPDRCRNSCLYVEPDYPYIHRELAKRGVTMTLLWEEYCNKCHSEGRTPYLILFLS